LSSGSGAGGVSALRAGLGVSVARQEHEPELLDGELVSPAAELVNTFCVTRR
jgi:hypothetical protein